MTTFYAEIKISATPFFGGFFFLFSRFQFTHRLHFTCKVIKHSKNAPLKKNTINSTAINFYLFSFDYIFTNVANITVDGRQKKKRRKFEKFRSSNELIQRIIQFKRDEVLLSNNRFLNAQQQDIDWSDDNQVKA